MARRFVLLSLLLAAVALPALGRSGSVAASGAADLCLGQVPTIVGAAGEDVGGTDGPDVVVSRGGEGAEIKTGDGDDLVCVIGVPDYDHSWFTIYAGGGDDRVDNSRSGFNNWTYLGDGADEYLGGPGTEFVSAYEDSPAAGSGPDLDVDLIRTAGSRDMVFSGGGSDLVDLGEAHDTLVLRGYPATDGVFTGGPRADSLHLSLVEPEPHSWTIDNRAERLLRDGQVIGGWDSFRRFEVKARGGPLKLRGSDQDERLVAWRPRWRLDVRMGGGEDRVEVVPGAQANHRINGGKGTDELAYGRGLREGWYEHPRDVHLDLSTGVLRDVKQSGAAAISFRVVNFENANLLAPHSGRTVMRGTSGPNVLSTNVGGATMYGMAGHDVMVGSFGGDTLIGGSGHDQAYGWEGIDRCEAEVRVACER